LRPIGDCALWMFLVALLRLKAPTTWKGYVIRSWLRLEQLLYWGCGFGSEWTGTRVWGVRGGSGKAEEQWSVCPWCMIPSVNLQPDIGSLVLCFQPNSTFFFSPEYTAIFNLISIFLTFQISAILDGILSWVVLQALCVFVSLWVC